MSKRFHCLPLEGCRSLPSYFLRYAMHARTSAGHPLGSRIAHVGDRSRAGFTLTVQDFSSTCNPLLPHP
jgi:hypothetical protein